MWSPRARSNMRVAVSSSCTICLSSLASVFRCLPMAHALLSHPRLPKARTHSRKSSSSSRSGSSFFSTLACPSAASLLRQAGSASRNSRMSTTRRPASVTSFALSLRACTSPRISLQISKAPPTSGILVPMVTTVLATLSPNCASSSLLSAPVTIASAFWCVACTTAVAASLTACILEGPSAGASLISGVASALSSPTDGVPGGWTARSEAIAATTRFFFPAFRLSGARASTSCSTVRYARSSSPSASFSRASCRPSMPARPALSSH